MIYRKMVGIRANNFGIHPVSSRKAFLVSFLPNFRVVRNNKIDIVLLQLFVSVALNTPVDRCTFLTTVYGNIIKNVGIQRFEQGICRIFCKCEGTSKKQIDSEYTSDS